MIEQPSPPPHAACLEPAVAAILVIWSCVAASADRKSSGLLLQTTVLRRRRLCGHALQIRKAKVFHELTATIPDGFPPSWTCLLLRYAAGEVLLFDTLKVVPAPFNAHLLAGVISSVAFPRLGSGVVSKHVRRPLLVSLAPCFRRIAFRDVEF